MKYIKLFGTLALISIFLSCNNSEPSKPIIYDLGPANLEIPTDSNKEYNFENSQRFKLYLNDATPERKIAAVKDYLTWFHIIGQEDFWNAGEYDMYAVYLYEAYDGQKKFHVYTIKSKKGFASASLVISSNFNVLDPNRANDKRKMFYEGNSGFRFVSESTIDTFKSVLNVAVSKKNIDKVLYAKYDDPFKALYYYDGRKYHLDAHETLTEEGLNTIDSLFRQSDIFKK